MRFDDVFFENEIRAGFFVPTEMKRVWAAQLEVLNEISNLCDKYGINYYADWGTMLGAVRHKGYIPWDDDLDICMKRHDYNLFIKVAQDELPETYLVINTHTYEEETQLFTRVVNNNYLRFDKEFLEKYHDCPFSVGLDVFPLDYFPNDIEERKTQQSIAEILFNLTKVFDAEELYGARFKDNVDAVLKLCGVSFNETKPVRQQLLLLLENIISLYGEKECEYLGSYVHQLFFGGTSLWPKAYFASSIEKEFETGSIKLPIAYEEMLKKKYGDYMKIVKDCGSHGYPYYEKQKNALVQHLGAKNRICEIENRPLYNRAKLDETNGKILFVVRNEKNWIKIQDLWENENLKSENVYVMSAPYYTKDFWGNEVSVHNECEYLRNVQNIKIKDESSLGEHFDKIYLDTGYDDMDDGVSLQKNYYVDKLKAITNELIFVTCDFDFEMEESDERSKKWLNDYCAIPGMVKADKVIVRYNSNKKIYIEKLVEIYGGETYDYWNDKITVIEKRDSARYISDEIRIWLTKETDIINFDNYKIILYGISESNILMMNESIKTKLQYSMEVFKENSDRIIPILYIDGDNMELRDFCKNNKWHLIDGFDDGEITNAVDAYYGDGIKMAELCREKGKAVMIQNYEIIE